MQHPLTQQPLAKKVILVTRPAHQCAKMLQLLQQQGARALSFPSIEISDIELNKGLKQQLASLNQYDLLIFISSNAVQYAQKLLQQSGIAIESIKTRTLVIGKATRAAALQASFSVGPGHSHLGPANSTQSPGFSSEALLQTPELQAERINTKKVAIIRGVGGLQQLGDTLLQRGAELDYIEVYRRGAPQQDVSIQRQQLSHNWPEMNISAITVTSNESLQNLYDMLETPGRDAMLKTRLIVPSNRCMLLARALGFETVAVAESATDEHILNALSHIMAED